MVISLHVSRRLLAAEDLGCLWNYMEQKTIKDSSNMPCSFISASDSSFEVYSFLIFFLFVLIL